MSRLRIFFRSAIFSYRAQFSWLNPTMWLTMKLILPLSEMAFFVFVGQFVNQRSLNPDPNLIPYIAIGNALTTVSWNTIFSVINITSHDKWDGTLPLVLATPASRLPLFVGRAMIHVLDGIINVAIAFVYAAFIFGVNFANADLLALTITVILTAFTMAGFGLLIGGLAFYFHNPLVFANIFVFILLIFCGVNFPVGYLPPLLQPISYAIPLTHGINAARQAIEGATLIQISPWLVQELIVGIVAIMVGYIFFITFEREARKTGKLEEV